MGFLPKEILEQLVRDGLKEGASLNVYDCSIKKIYQEVFDVKDFNNLYITIEYIKIIKWIDNTYKIGYLN